MKITNPFKEVLFIFNLDNSLLSKSKLEKKYFTIVSKNSQRHILKNEKESIFVKANSLDQFALSLFNDKTSFSSYRESDDSYGYYKISVVNQL